jgi:hypothetical protein
MPAQLPGRRPRLTLLYKLAVHGEQQLALAATEPWVRLDRLADANAGRLGRVGRNLPEQPTKGAKFKSEKVLQPGCGGRPRGRQRQLPLRHGAPRHAERPCQGALREIGVPAGTLQRLGERYALRRRRQPGSLRGAGPSSTSMTNRLTRRPATANLVSRYLTIVSLRSTVEQGCHD